MSLTSVLFGEATSGGAAWFARPGELVSPEREVVCHVASRNALLCDTALRELRRHIRVSTEKRDGAVPGGYACHGYVIGFPFRAWSYGELSAQLRRVTGDAGLVVMLRESGATLGVTGRIERSAERAGAIVSNTQDAFADLIEGTALGAADTARGAGGIAQSIGAGVGAVGQAAANAPPGFGLLFPVAGIAVAVLAIGGLVWVLTRSAPSVAMVAKAVR